MIRMTDRAQDRVDEYLDRVRRALSGHPAVDPDEVVADVRSHIEESLRERPAPVGEDELTEVLDQLGSPGRWAPAEELEGWQGALARIRRGPDDWRLAYLCLGLTVLAVIAAPFGGLLLLIPAFVLARGTFAIADERDQPLGPKRWLVYPALVAVYMPLALVMLLWPVLVSGAVFSPGGFMDWMQGMWDIPFPSHGSTEHWTSSVAWTAVATGAWWSVAGGIAAIRPTWVRRLFLPFAGAFRRPHAWGPVLIGVLASLAGITVLALS
jgi:hypothetical protein